MVAHLATTYCFDTLHCPYLPTDKAQQMIGWTPSFFRALSFLHIFGASGVLRGRPGRRQLSSPDLQVLPVAIFFLALAAASDVCRAGPNIGGAEQRPSSEATGGWHVVHTSKPADVDAISIMHTADTSRSDLDLAGLMIRCNDGRPEVAIVLIRPFTLRMRPHVVFGQPGNETQLEATVAAPGTAVVLPTDATTLVNGSWRALKDLLIRVEEGQDTIRGVVVLAGLQTAFNELVASCPPR
jgi:hypothetical protein